MLIHLKITLPLQRLAVNFPQRVYGFQMELANGTLSLDSGQIKYYIHSCLGRLTKPFDMGTCFPNTQYIYCMSQKKRPLMNRVPSYRFCFEEGYNI